MLQTTIAHIEVYNTVYLTNDVHNAFMKDNADTLVAIGKTDYEPFESLRTAFLNAFAEEEKLYKYVTATPCRAEMHAKAEARKKELGAMKAAIKLRQRSSLEGRKEADFLLAAFALYAKDLKRKSIETLNTTVRNLLQDLSTEKAQAALATLNVMHYFKQVKTLHEETEELTSMCRTYDSQKLHAALQLARQKMDELYYILSRKLQGFANTFGAPYMAAVPRWNASIDRFKAIIKNRATARKAARRKVEAEATKVLDETLQMAINQEVTLQETANRSMPQQEPLTTELAPHVPNCEAEESGNDTSLAVGMAMNFPHLGSTNYIALLPRRCEEPSNERLLIDASRNGLLRLST